MFKIVLKCFLQNDAPTCTDDQKVSDQNVIKFKLCTWTNVFKKVQ